MNTLHNTALLAALSAPLLAQGSASPQPTSQLHLNEVMFDPSGTAGSENVWQYVELTASGVVDTRNMELRDANGARLFRLPGYNLEDGEILLVLFGPRELELENRDPSLGPYAVTTGHAFGDHLGVASGGVRLHAANGATLDQIYWGSGSAPGQPFVDLSYAGGAPFQEGDSIGRRADYAAGSAQSAWAISGGATSNGPTPGAANLVPIPSDSELVLFQDSIVNEIFAGLNTPFDGQQWLDVESTSPKVTSYLVSGDVATIVVDHSFGVVINGAPITLRGALTTTFTRTTTAGATAEDFVTQGAISSVGGQYGLDVNMSINTNGRHGLASTHAFSTSFDWTHAGISYSANVAGSGRAEFIGPAQIRSTESRSGSDWGGAGRKAASITTISTQTGDGRYSLTSTLQRSFPALLPIPGGSQTATGEIEQIVEDSQFEIGDGGMVRSGTTTRYDHTVGTFPYLSLQPGAQGVFSMVQTVNGSAVDFHYEERYPAVNGLGQNFELRVAAIGSVQDLGGKQLSTGSVELFGGQTSIRRTTFAIDPPLVQDPEKPKKKPWYKRAWKATKKFVTTSVACAAGGLGADKKTGSFGTKRAIMRTIGKTAGRKLIPVVGQVTTAVCVGKAAGDLIFGE